MPAFAVILAQIPPENMEKMGSYVESLTKLLPTFDGKYAIRGFGAELLEGKFGHKSNVIIIEFPKKERAMEFWDSKEYTEVKKLRAGIADVNVLLIEAESMAQVSV